MERHFVLAATVAAALHGLLLGIPRGPVPTTGPKPLVSRSSDVRPSIPLVPAERTEDDHAASTPGGSPDVARIPDRPTADEKALFTVPVEVGTIERVSPVPIFSIPANPFGEPGESRGDGRPGVIGYRLLDKSPRARVQVAPDYPFAAKHEGRNGSVTVEFIVDEAGRVHEPRVVESSDAIFDEAAVRAVAKWRFEPGTVKGLPVRFRMAVPIVFRLDGE